MQIHQLYLNFWCRLRIQPSAYYQGKPYHERIQREREIVKSINISLGRHLV